MYRISNEVENSLLSLYTWVDQVPLSRPKQSIARDFSDGVLFSEVCAFFCPWLVELHNYSNRSSRADKTEQWACMNRKVLKHLDMVVPGPDVQDIIGCKAGAIEKQLGVLKDKVEA